MDFGGRIGGVFNGTGVGVAEDSPEVLGLFGVLVDQVVHVG